MKIIVKMCDGAPILFFPDEIENNKMILSYQDIGQHGPASRAFMRQCKSPKNDAELALCWDLLKRYSNFYN